MTCIPLPRYAADYAALWISESLAEQFPGWRIELSPLGMWQATWRSADGRDSHHVMAFTARQLAGKLSNITKTSQ